MQTLFLRFGLGVAKVIAVKLYEEGGVWLKGAIEPVGLAIDFFPVDADALGECVAWIGMVRFEFDVTANAAGNVDGPTVRTGGNFLPGLDQNLLTYGLANIVEIDSES